MSLLDIVDFGQCRFWTMSILDNVDLNNVNFEQRGPLWCNQIHQLKKQKKNAPLCMLTEGEWNIEEV